MGLPSLPPLIVPGAQRWWCRSVLKPRAADQPTPSYAHSSLPPSPQVFTALYNTDDNVLLAAPTGSGKTIAAEFAILRAVQRAADGKGAAR